MAEGTAQITIPEEAIRSFCLKWGVREFALFGSVLREDFSESSDIDVLVRFDSGQSRTFFDLFAMSSELEEIFGRKVDLLTRNSIEQSPNYLRRQRIEDSLQVIYAA